MNCCASRVTRLGERMVSMSSTLVETVSINYEDFNESFLTCGTCLCMYDGGEHIPRLLPCSHTVCLQCLTRIAASQTREVGTFRCPICRESINIPRGGIPALPPSFLVNQLLDLMSRQRREVIPKCSVHNNQELLFCETCDTVFCTLCTGGNHIDGRDSDPSEQNEHTIIPFSIAIKRMSEILLYKANECIGKLSQAQDGVTREIQRLDVSKENCLNQVNNTFQQIVDLIEARKRDMIMAITEICNEKRKVLEEQHSLIDAEKSKVEQECEGLQYQVEVRNITQRISSLSEKLDAASLLAEPRENSFISCNFDHNDRLKTIEDALQHIGRVRTSTTFPSLCTANLQGDKSVVGLEATVCLVTVDYHGNNRATGGDPVIAEVTSMNSVIEQLTVRIVDCDDGSYKIKFRPTTSGRFCIKISVFDRPIKDCPLFFEVCEFNNPILIYGQRGSGDNEFLQPVAVAIDKSFVYVLDTGNCRIKVLDLNLNFIRHINNNCLEGRSVTGMAISNNGLVVVNWRTRFVTEMSLQGSTIKSFTYQLFQEPTHVAVDKGYGHILVADNGLNLIFVFDADGKILFQVGTKKGTFQNLSAITVGLNGEILTADYRLQIFSAKGDFMEEFKNEGKGKGRYGHMVVDNSNRLIVNRTDKGRNFIQILSLNDGSILSVINSNESRLKRPAGLAVTEDHHVIVADLCNDCLKKYRYW